MNRIFRKITKVGIKEKVEEDKGYKLLMSVVDRKVFGVEDESISGEEFKKLSRWVVSKFEEDELGERSLVGKVINKEPLILAEVIGGEPIFLEIHDYDVRYRVNIFEDRGDVDIRVLESIKEKELQYGYTREVSYQL